jgi:sugar phosphate permease
MKTEPGPTHVRWQVFGLAFATSALLYLHRYSFAYIKPALQDAWGLDKTELGRLDSAFSVFYSLLQFPFAILADGLGIRLVLTLLMLVWMAGLGMTASAGSVRMMSAAQATLGVGQSAVYACLSRISWSWFPRSLRTTLQGAVGVLAGRLGALGAGLVFSTFLIGYCELDWRSAMWILVAVGLVHVALFAAVFRNSPRGHPEVNEAELRLIEGTRPPGSSAIVESAERLGIGATLRLATPRSLVNLGCLCVQSILSTFADNIYSNWIPLFVAEVYGLKYKEMGIYSALPLLGGAIAGLVGGILNDYAIARTGNRRWSRVGVAFVGKGLAALLISAALLFYDSPHVFCGFLFFVKFFGDWSLATSLGVVTDIGGKATASVFGFNNAVAGIGSIVGPLAFGAIADAYGWPAVFVTVAVTYALCALSWLVIDCTIPVIDESRRSAT